MWLTIMGRHCTPSNKHDETMGLPWWQSLETIGFYWIAALQSTAFCWLCPAETIFISYSAVIHLRMQAKRFAPQINTFGISQCQKVSSFYCQLCIFAIVAWHRRRCFAVECSYLSCEYWRVLHSVNRIPFLSNARVKFPWIREQIIRINILNFDFMVMGHVPNGFNSFGWTICWANYHKIDRMKLASALGRVSHITSIWYSIFLMTHLFAQWTFIELCKRGWLARTAIIFIFMDHLTISSAFYNWLYVHFMHAAKCRCMPWWTRNEMAK